jgi:CRISPR/Cas system CSM-associated protein Csm2 small subunit
MSGTGHVQDMNNRIKQNRAQRPSKRHKFKENNRGAIYSSSEHEDQNLKFKTVSEEKLTEIIKRIRKRAKKERQKEGIVLGVLGIIVIITAISIFQWI